MNPRHRRLLIPGLLAALLVVVVIAALAGRSEAATTPEARGEVVSTIDDPRITEASGMAISRDDDDLAYVVNDSDQAQELYAVEISTGDVVGVTRVTGGTWVDTEALAIDDDGTLWIADTGDNLVQRTDAALYALPEPGRGDSTVEATRYPVAFDDGSEDAEALLVQPGTGAKFLVSKGFVAGDVYALPADLSTTRTSVARKVARAPGVVTDGSFLPDGSRALLRTYGDVREVDASDWSEIRRTEVAPLQQSETLAVAADGGSVLIGSEGAASPLVRVPLPGGGLPTAEPTPTATPTPVPVDARSGEPSPTQGFAWRNWAGVAVLLIGLTEVSAWMARGR